MQVAVQPDDYSNEDIAGQGDKIQREEEYRQQELQFPNAGEAQEHKTLPGGCIGLAHPERHPDRCVGPFHLASRCLASLESRMRWILISLCLL